MKKKTKIRLFVETPLNSGFAVTLDESQSHYLCNVMKCMNGDEILGFDNQNGEFLCVIKNANKKAVVIEVLKQTQNYITPPDVCLLFAPVKKDQTDFIIQKATELGALKIIPVITERTIAEKVKLERFKAQAIEAAEQSRRVDVPEIMEAMSLNKSLSSWDENRKLYFMDESGMGRDIFAAFSQAKTLGISKVAILTGPEGGFSEEEFAMLRKMKFAEAVSMGKRILRAETAVAAALACWQAIAGDWQN